MATKSNLSKKNRKAFIMRAVVSFVATVLLLCLYSIIFSFSEQTGESSGRLSMRVSERCIELFGSITDRGWTESVIRELAIAFEHHLRKIAHFSEYALLGILVFGIFRPWMQKQDAKYCFLLNGKKWRWFVIIWVVLSAAADEFHQTFVPERDGNLIDVCIDTAGGMTGLLFCIFIEWIVTKIKYRKKHV